MWSCGSGEMFCGCPAYLSKKKTQELVMLAVVLLFRVALKVKLEKLRTC